MENNILFFENQIQLDCGDFCICLNMAANWTGMSCRHFKELMQEIEKSPVDNDSKLKFLEHINNHLLELNSHYATLFNKSKSKYSWKRLNRVYDFINICSYTYAKIERG